MTDKKIFLVFPGYIPSETDGQRHYISARKLMELYNVSPAKCKIVYQGQIPHGLKIEDYWAIGPLYNGNYPDWSGVTLPPTVHYKAAQTPEPDGPTVLPCEWEPELTTLEDFLNEEE